MRKKNLKMIVVLLMVSILLMPVSGMETSAATTPNVTKSTKAAKVKKPAQVKNLKKVKISTKYYKKKKNSLNCQAICSAKIKFNKVKGATGYQVLVYRNKTKGLKTPLVCTENTKNTTFTIKNLVPDVKYIIKVRAYKKYKNNNIIYGKTKSITFKTGGKKKGCYFVCNTCGVSMPGNDHLLAKHTRDAYKLYKELHAGYTYYVK